MHDCLYCKLIKTTILIRIKMAANPNENPFMQLFQTEEDFSRVQELLKDEVEELDAPTLKITDPYEEPLTNEYRSNLLEKIFLFTVRETGRSIMFI